MRFIKCHFTSNFVNKQKIYDRHSTYEVLWGFRIWHFFLTHTLFGKSDHTRFFILIFNSMNYCICYKLYVRDVLFCSKKKLNVVRFSYLQWESIFYETYLEEEWICGATKVDIGSKSPFVLWQDSNDFQNNESCLNSGLSRIINRLIPWSSR